MKAPTFASDERRRAAALGLTKAVLEAANGLVPIDDYAIMFGPNPDQKFTALMVACQFLQFNTTIGTQLSSANVKALLDAGANPNMANPSNGITALFLAVKYANPETVDMLLKAGANALARDCYGRTALHNAVERAMPGVVRLLLDHGCLANERIVEQIDTSQMVCPFVPSMQFWSPCILYIICNVRCVNIIICNVMFAQDPGGKPVIATYNAAERGIIAHEASFLSWKLMGPPSLDDYVATFQMLLCAGAELGIIAMRQLQRYRLAGCSERYKEKHLDPMLKWPEMTIALAQAYLGVSFPGHHPRADWTGTEIERDRSDKSIPLTENQFRKLFRPQGLKVKKNDCQPLIAITGPGAGNRLQDQMTREQLKVECTALNINPLEESDTAYLSALNEYDNKIATFLAECRKSISVKTTWRLRPHS